MPGRMRKKAFHQALSGVRKFPEENVDLYVFFVMVMRSLISHLAEKRRTAASTRRSKKARTC